MKEKFLRLNSILTFGNHLKNIRRVFRGRDFYYNPETLFQEQTSIYVKSIIAVKFFYLCIFISSLSFASHHWDLLFESNFSEPLWPLKILGWPAYSTSIISTPFYLLIIGSIGAFLYPFYRVFRIAVFLSVFYIVALINSDGLFGNNNHMMLYPAFLFQFLPNIGKKIEWRKKKYMFVSIFWFAQFAVCLAYAMAGYFKVTEIFSCLIEQGYSRCEVGPNIMTNMAAREFLQFRKPTFVGNLLYDYPWIGGLSYLGVIWFHVISLFFAFRFDLHRFFMSMRVVFHYGTLILFGIGFDSTILVIVALFALSPFQVGHYKSIYEFILRLPPLGYFNKLQSSSILKKQFSVPLKVKARSWVWFRRSVMLYTLVNVLFMLTYYPLTGEKNLYPLFTWHIFRPEPIRYVDHNQLLITSIDGKDLLPPQEIIYLKDKFPNIDIYKFAGKVHELSSVERRGDQQKMNYLMDDIEKELLKKHKNIGYKVVRLIINPIRFVVSGEKIEEKIVLERNVDNSNE